MDLVQEEFLQRLNFYQHSWLPARALVEEALAQRFKVDLGSGLGARDSPDPCGPLGLLLYPSLLGTLLPFRWTQVGRLWNLQKVDALGRNICTT